MSIHSNILECVSIGDLVASLAQGIADAQLALDTSSIRVAGMMAQRNLDFDGQKVSVLELGLTPGFYQFVETVLEVKISITTVQETSSEDSSTKKDSSSESTLSGSVGLFKASASASTTTKTSTVNTRDATRFQYGSEISSSLRTRIVPVPPPALLLDRLRIKEVK